MSIDFTTEAATHIRIEADHEKARKSNSPQEQEKAVNQESNFWGEDGFGFDDLIDLVNPLQHIPVVSSIYREITGDEIAPGPRMIGGAVLGGVTGFVASAANVIFEQETGKDIAEQVVSLFESEPEEAPTQVAKASDLLKDQAPTEQLVASAAPMELLNMNHIKELTPLDFGAVEETKPELVAQTHVEKEPQDAIQASFDEAHLELQDMLSEYRKAQLIAHVMGVGEDMKL